MTTAPRTLGVPPRAADAYAALRAQIALTGPTPCAAAPDAWTGSPREQETAASACQDCAALAHCYRYAAQADELEGTWGGLTATERAKRRRVRAATEHTTTKENHR
jgi:hypothetical protein